MTLGPTETALIGVSTVLLVLVGYWIWIKISGWLADRRWRRYGVDRRSDQPGRRETDG